MKFALVIGSSKYDDPKLAQLRTPEADTRELARVLRTKSIGNFDEVVSLLDQPEAKTRRAISAFLSDKKPDDLVLLYFSGHGVLDGRGNLFLASKDTEYDSLNATAISSSFLSYEMDSCRSRKQVLILDCCNSGAFARAAKGPQKAVTESTFEGNGSGRVVLTASDSTQFAFEGDRIIPQTEFSLFTHFLLEGLKTGKADRDNDGKVSLDEWYDYCHSKITATTPQQVPHKWSYRQQGDLVIAQNPFANKKAQPKTLQLRAMLDQKQKDFQQHGLLLDSKELEILADELSRTKLELQEDDKRLILLSAVVYDDGQKWLGICGVNGVEWLRQAYQDENCPYDARVGAIRFLGKIEDGQTYGRLLGMLPIEPRSSKGQDWLDLLANYLNSSALQHHLPWSMKRYVLLRLIEIKVRESMQERMLISRVSMVIGFICSFVTYFLSKPDQPLVEFILAAGLYSAIGAVLAVVFAQGLTFTIYSTQKWMCPWQALIMSGVGCIIGAGIFFSVGAYLRVFFLGGIVGIIQTAIGRTGNKILQIALVILAFVLVFVFSAVALNKIPAQMSRLGYSFSAALFSGVYSYSVFRAKSFPRD